jgi:hypothetical protein
MPKLPLPAAATELGIAYSTLHRRMTVLGVTPEEDESGALFVDTDALKKAWDERPTTPRQKPRGGRGGAVNVIVDKETREQLDTIAEVHDVSLAEAARQIISRGLISYYQNGRRLDG